MKFCSRWSLRCADTTWGFSNCLMLYLKKHSCLGKRELTKDLCMTEVWDKKKEGFGQTNLFCSEALCTSGNHKQESNFLFFPFSSSSLSPTPFPADELFSLPFEGFLSRPLSLYSATISSTLWNANTPILVKHISYSSWSCSCQEIWVFWQKPLPLLKRAYLEKAIMESLWLEVVNTSYKSCQEYFQ
jgi:hypothetical protein